MAGPSNGAKEAEQLTSSHDWGDEEDRPVGNRRLRSDFEGIWNPSRRDSELSWALPSDPNNIRETGEYDSEDTDGDASGIHDTRRERYARERQLSWSLPPAYDDLPDRNTISDDGDYFEDQMDNLMETNENSESLTKMLKEMANANMTDEEMQQELAMLGQEEKDYLGDFPPLPSAEQQSEEYTLRPPWNTPKYAKNFLSQQQQIQQLLQPPQGTSGQSDIPDQVTLQHPALQGPNPQTNAIQGAYVQQTVLRAPDPQASGLHGPYAQMSGLPVPGATNATLRNLAEASHPSVGRFPYQARDLDRDVIPAKGLEEKEKAQKSFTIKHFKTYLNETGLSLFPAKEFIAQTVTTDRLVRLNFAGLDQLTDIFFRILMDHGVTVYLPHLRQFSASGCVHLTDAGVRWLCKLSPVLDDITLIGCRKITSASLSLLLGKEPPLKSVDMSCTGVSTLPLSYGSSSVDLRLDGCPVICPIKKKLNKAYLKEPKSYVADGSAIFEEVQYKVVILKSGKTDLNFGKYLSEGPSNSPPDSQPMTFTRGVTIGKYKLNVYEINRVQAAQDLIISDGSICLFPFYLESCTADRLDYLCSFYFRKIAYILSKSEHVVPVLVGLHNGKMEGREARSRLMNLKNGVIRRLEACQKPLEERLHIMIKRKWLVHDYDMKGQLYAGDAAVMLDKLRTTPVFTEIIDTHRKVNPEKFLKDARSHVNSAFSWMMVNCAETQAVMDRLLEEKGPIMGFTESEATEKIGQAAEKAGFKTSKMHQPYLKTIARAMNQKGSLLYFPEVDRCPLITNPRWLADVLGILMNPPPPDEKMKRLIRFLSKDQPVWTKQALQEALAGIVQEEQLELLLPLLLDYGILLECAVDRIASSDVPYAYVPLDPLPNEPPINLSDIWAESRYETVVQRNKHYQFSCGAPLSLYSSFMSQCAKIYKFTLLWKYGFLIRQGVVDILVGLESNGRDEPVICVSGRTEYQRSEATAVRVNCLWSVMNKITTILDHIIKRYSCFATVVIPCPTCIPTMINSKIVKDEDVWLYYVILLKAGATRGLKCRSKKYKCSETPLNNTRTVEQLFGPDLSLVPQHMTSQLTSCNDALSDYNRCALCQGCAIKGRDCPGYGLMGKTVRHCGCEEVPNFPLCLSCGMCQRCETYLQTIHSSLNPQTIRNATWKQYNMKFTDKSGNSNVVVAQEGKVVQHPKFSWFHTQGGQLYVLDNVNFSPDLFNSIDILYFRGMKASVGLVREDHTPIITFNPTEGCTGKDWSTGGVTGQKKWIIKNCTLFSMKIRYVPVHAKMKDTSEHSGGKTPRMFAVDFYKAGERLWSEYLSVTNMKVALTGSGAGSMIIQTSTLSTEVPLTLDHPDAKEGKLYAEVERPDYPNQLVLCSITPQTENNTFIVTTEDGPVQMARDDQKIHPLGYSFASNADRTLFLLPKHREMSSVPTTFYKRKKKKPLATPRDKAIVTCIEDLSTLIEKKIVLPAPLWFFTEGQRNGWEPSILDMCNCQRFYESTEAQVCAYTRSRPRFVEWVRSAVEEQIAYESFASVLLLPAKIDERSLMYPTLPPHSKQEMFQAVYLCSGSEESLDIHLLNMKGMTLPEGQADLTNFFLPFHVFISLGCQVFLPGYEKMLPEVAAGSLDDDRVQYYLRELLLYITSSLVIFNAGGKVPEVGDVTEDTLKFVYSAIEHSSKENKTKNNTSAIAICPAHRENDNIDPNDFDDSPEIRQYLQFVKTVKLEQTVETLPSDFFQQLRALEEFKVEQCDIKELPSNISLCTNLTSLKLAGSKITELPSSLTQLQAKLRELDISHLNISSLPKVVTKLKKLEVLTADCLLLDSLPDTIGELANLREFSLVGSCLSQLPKSFSNLKKLSKLSLSGVPWPQVKRGQYLTNAGFNDFLTKWNLKDYFKRYQRQHGDNHDILKPFDADNNLTLDPTEMGKLNAKIFNMFPRFGFYGESTPVAESTGGFPNELLQLMNLTHLDLSYQGIVSVPEDISRLAKLETIVLSDNPYLTSVPGTVGSLPLERLDISDCPSLRTPPREITSKGLLPVMAYLRRLTTGSVKCKRTKLMLVGLGGAGKTSLVKALLGGTNMAHLESGQDITDGIDIHSWTVKRKEESVTYSVWDFAGQTVYYNTHQFFLSNRAIYLLLWNLRLGAEHAGLDFWLSSISVHAPHAPILVVGSHLDQVQQFDVPTQQLQKRYPQIAGFHSISTLTGMGVADLQEKLFSVTLQEKYMGEDIPEVWLNFEKAVINERGTSTNIINYKRVEEIAFASGIFDELESSQAVQFLHDLGTVQHFDNEFLKDQVVINPQWIVDVMACVVSVKDSPIKEGKFKHSDVSKVWHEHPKKLHKWLLRLTEKFDLTFPLAEKEMNIVPCLLPETEPEISWPAVEKVPGHKESSMAYRFEYLPVGLFNRGQVRLYGYCDSSIIWKRGSLLKKNGHTALLTQPKDNKLLVKCQGPRPENMLFMIHEVFETLIQESFKGVVYDYKVPCPDCLGMDRDPYMFKGSTVRRASGLKTPFLQCSKNFHVLSIADLIGVCPPTESQDYDLHLKNTVRSLTDIRLDLSVDVFMSCCQADLPEIDQDFVDPRKVKAKITDAGYTCWFESAVEKDGLEERILALRDAKVFVAMISNSYANDKDCCNLFKFARTVLKKPLVLVTVGPHGPDNWKQSTIGMLVANEGYCNMQRVEHNKTKMDELLKILSEKLSDHYGNALTPTCFISCCWKNSKRAADMGQRSTSGAVGYGDPIDMKDYLEENGVKTCIDLDRAGQGGMLEDIAEGLRGANTMVACLSDEYADSIRCQMEFRFAAKVLQLPIVLAIVGRSQRWRATELGLHSPNYPEVNFEESADDGMRKLLELVTKHTTTKFSSGHNLRKTRSKMYEEQTRAAYQELYELAQRRTLRQLTSYIDVYEMQPFPRIIVIDFADPEDDESHDQGRDTSLIGRPVLKRASSLGHRPDNSFLQRNLCLRFFCEYEQGWHTEGRAIPIPETMGESELVRFSPYLARTIAVIQLSPKIRLNCIGGEEGKKYIKWLEENCDEQGENYKSSYQDLRRYAAKAKHGKPYGSLARCLTSTGKVFWLCEDHQKSAHITRMSETASQHSNQAKDASLDSHMLGHLKPLKVWEEQAELLKPKPPVALVSSPVAPVQSKAAPTPKPRTSLIKSNDKPGTSRSSATTVFNPKNKFKAAGYAAQASVKAKNYQKGSKACVLL